MMGENDIIDVTMDSLGVSITVGSGPDSVTKHMSLSGFKEGVSNNYIKELATPLLPKGTLSYCEQSEDITKLVIYREPSIVPVIIDYAPRYWHGTEDYNCVLENMGDDDFGDPYVHDVDYPVEGEELNILTPHLVMSITLRKVKDSDLYALIESELYALKSPPDSMDTPLFRAPLPNIFTDSKLCWNSVLTELFDNKLTLLQAGSLISLFLNTTFNEDLTPILDYNSLSDFRDKVLKHETRNLYADIRPYDVLKYLSIATYEDINNILKDVSNNNSSRTLGDII